MKIDIDTIWPDLDPSNYLTKDYFEAGEEKALTIKEVKFEEVANPAIQKKENNFVAYWEEDLPPMVLGAKKNRRAIQELTGTNRPAKWKGVRLLVFVDPTVKLRGETVGGLRIRNYPPKDNIKPKTSLCSVCGKEIKEFQGVSTDRIIKESVAELGKPTCIPCWKKIKAEENHDKADS